MRGSALFFVQAPRRLQGRLLNELPA